MATRPISSFASPSHPSSQHSLISIRSLQLPNGIIAPDVWGKPKDQPALVSLTLLLNTDFSSAADTDKLDDSTIHYGQLAKTIRSASKENQTAGDVSYAVEMAILKMGKKGNGKFIVAKSTVEVSLPKASMFGEGITLINTTSYDGEGKAVECSRVFSVKDVKIMTLIGVNGYERSQKQPLVASILLHLRPEAETTDSSQTVALFNLEQLLVQVIQDTSFETLETLADFTVSQLRSKMLDSVLPGTRVQLRIEKPRAIAFADAPAVEVVRDVPFSKDLSKRSTTVVSSESKAKGKEAVQVSTPSSATSQAWRLSIIRPYVD